MGPSPPAEIERILRRAAHDGGKRPGAVQDLGQREPGRRRISSILARWQRLGLASRGDERLSQQQLPTATLPGFWPGRHAQPGHRDRKLAEHPCTRRNGVLDEKCGVQDQPSARSDDYGEFFG